MTISRRSLLKSSLGGIGLFAGAQSVMAATPQWDETVDVIVVGSGFAGLMAAYMAKKLAAKSSFWKNAFCRRQLDHQRRHHGRAGHGNTKGQGHQRLP